ncbi:arginine--tRNA ligase [bacterium]
MIQKKLEEIILQTWLEISDEKIEFQLEEPPKNINADFAVNICFLASKVLKRAPRQIAEEFIEKLTENKLGENIYENVFIAGPGFLNFTLKKNLYVEELKQIYTQDTKYGHSAKGQGEKVLVEFVSANPTGPLHIGHGRGAVIGDCVARILKAAGYYVECEYYVNDFGNQISILGRSVEARLKQLKGEEVQIPEDFYKGEYVIDIAKELLATGKDTFGIGYVESFAMQYIMETIKKDLADFGVIFDTWFHESQLYNSEGEKSSLDFVLDKLEEKKALVERDGALWIDMKDRHDDDKDRVIVRADKRPTYFASDIAYHDKKYKRGFTKLINVWGADHHGYIPRLKAAVSCLGYDEKSLEIILYQLVSLYREGTKIAMSTRGGQFVPLKEVVDEVGRDAARFFLIMRGSDNAIDFDLDLAKKHSSENPVYYVQYAHARISSLFRAAESTGKYSFEKILGKLDDFYGDEEVKVIKELVKFPEVINRCADQLSPHYITLYLQELAAVFHAYYTRVRVLDDDIQKASSRLILCKCIAVTIKNGLNLLGINAPSKM